MTPTIQTIEDGSDRFSANGVESEKFSETPVMGVEPEESNFSNMKCAIDDPATNFSLGISLNFKPFLFSLKLIFSIFYRNNRCLYTLAFLLNNLTV